MTPDEPLGAEAREQLKQLIANAQQAGSEEELLAQFNAIAHQLRSEEPTSQWSADAAALELPRLAWFTDDTVGLEQTPFADAKPATTAVLFEQDEGPLHCITIAGPIAALEMSPIFWHWITPSYEDLEDAMGEVDLEADPTFVHPLEAEVQKESERLRGDGYSSIVLIGGAEHPATVYEGHGQTLTTVELDGVSILAFASGPTELLYFHENAEIPRAD